MKRTYEAPMACVCDLTVDDVIKTSSDREYTGEWDNEW